MLGLFRSRRQQEECDAIWLTLIQQARQTMPQSLPILKKSHAKYFIRAWNRAYEQSSPTERIGLAVFAYRVEVHRYAAGMLIHSKTETRLEGIRILGNMGDESVWPLLSRLIKHADKQVSLLALEALIKINEGRAKREFTQIIPQKERPFDAQELTHQLADSSENSPS